LATNQCVGGVGGQAQRHAHLLVQAAQEEEAEGLVLDRAHDVGLRVAYSGPRPLLPSIQVMRSDVQSLGVLGAVRSV
jgi:hypothetical protein